MSASVHNFRPIRTPKALSDADRHVWALFWHWLNTARVLVPLYEHTPKPSRFDLRPARRAALADAHAAFRRACECLDTYAKVESDFVWRKIERQMMVDGMKENLENVRRRLVAEQKVLGHALDLVTLPGDLADALTVTPANLTAPLPARPRRTKKEGLPMARPLKPSLQWHVDHWRFRCRVKDAGRPWIDLPVGLAVRDAEARALELATLAASGQLASPAVPRSRGKAAPSETVAQWCTRWCEEREERGLTSVRGDRGRLATYVLPIIGPRPIATVTQEQIEAVVTDLDKRVRAKTMSWKTASNVWGNVSKLFDDASHAKDRTLRVRSDNPAKGIRGPDRGTKKVKAFLYPSEAHALLACEAVPLDFRKAAALAIYLGLRAGELRSLRWDDIDIEHGTVHVHQSYDRDKHAAKATKTKSARRFTFEPTVRPLLAAMHAEAEGKGLVLDMRRFFKSADDLRAHLRTAGVTRADLFVTDETRKNLTFHDLRATTLTWMAVRGDDPLKIKARAGHSDLATTEGYIRTAGEIDGAIGTVFAPLPNGLTGGFGQDPVSASGSIRRETGSKMGRPQEESDLRPTL